jgi:ABC-type transport system involved in cytochrome c biogenesis permease subunit
LANRFEFALSFVWTIVGLYLLLEISWYLERGRFPGAAAVADKFANAIPPADAARGSNARALSASGPFVLLTALSLATYALTRSADQQAAGPLLPALRSPWLQIHGVSALLSYAAFAVATSLALLQWGCWLVRDGGRRFCPTEEHIERGMLRLIALGFPWLTLSIFTGAIWAQQAWGRYWGWDPKESWALVTWLWYGMTLHLRPLRRWRGRRLATLVIVGFALVLFTFIGVPWLVRVVRLETLHGY